MLEAVMKKILGVIWPAAIKNNASFTVAEIDSLGFDYAEFVFMYGASDIGMATLKLQESDVTGSGQTDITGLIFGTSLNDTGSTSALPSSTDDNKLFKFEVDLRGRKRFLTLVATAGNGSTGSYGAAFCELSRGQQVPTTAAQKGVAQNLRVP